jgi:O-antigen ligase
MSRYPVFGKGFGTFLPNYRILDNAYLLLAIELGVIGLAAFLALLWASAWSASRARRLFADPLDRALAQSLLASMVAGAVLLAFFDGLSFPISSGMFFLVIGLCSGALRLAQWESGHVLRTG